MTLDELYQKRDNLRQEYVNADTASRQETIKLMGRAINAAIEWKEKKLDKQLNYKNIKSKI